MDNHTFRVLEFDKILQMASVFAVTAPGRAIVNSIRPLNDIAEIRERIAFVLECRRLLAEDIPLGIENIDNFTPIFHKIRPADAVLETLELRSFLPLFYSSLNLRNWTGNTDYPHLGAIVSQLNTHADLKKSIEASIDGDGTVRDGASSELYSIRQGIKSNEKKIRGILDAILKKKELEPHLQDFYMTERNNRWVIPVKLDSKGSVSGVIHDISNTGETVFIEPYSVQQVGNELELYRAEERREEYRILQQLSSQLREQVHQIEEDYKIVAAIDAVQAIAGFSEQMNMSAPEISETGYMNIISGRHPLLWQSLSKENRVADITPLDLKLDGNHSCMVITGSNAGGKTVALKTTGVLNLMALSGMHIPADYGTSIPFLQGVLADIGDEQSIEQNLSTFSAHIMRISGIVGQSSSKTLVIVDELGTGTDPEQGGALSCAVLKKLKKLGSLVLVSTHLGVLKAFAGSEQGLVNGSMEMEETQINGISSFRPTYRLVIGEPGTSHAFEIAESLGLPKDIIRDAREFITGEGAEVDSLIAELKKKSADLEIRFRENEKLNQEAADLKKSLEEERSAINAAKQETLAKAVEAAEGILGEAKRDARDIIRAMKQSSLSDARKNLKDLEQKHNEIKKAKEVYSAGKIKQLKNIREGRSVFIKSLGLHGSIHSVNRKALKCKVLVDGKEVVVPFSELYEPSAASTEETTFKTSSNGNNVSLYRFSGRADDSDISNELNVIGKRVDPSLSLIERFLNDVSLSGIKQVKIIHGIGTGVLASAIRDFLEDHPLVESWRNGDEYEGGEAVTIVFL
jgi:DNA mismatch repair protein MutS2